MERSTEWHARSWNQCVRRGLAEVIGRYCDVSTYRVEAGSDSRGATIELGVLAGEAEVSTRYEGVPMPDDDGVFRHADTPLLIVPISEDVSMTRILCAGEQLEAFIAERLTPLTADLVNSEASLRNWLPLSEWLELFFSEQAQVLDIQNQIATETHRRRVKLIGASGVDRDVPGLCPFEQPEGPNLGRVLTVSANARVGEGRLLVEEAAPDIGPAASYIPFLDRDDPVRLLMGSNMMRQWIPPLQPECALVRTGTEPDTPEFWCGFNLLTAFASLGRGTTEDGIVISRSAARRMSYPEGVDVGDKLSNRHGQKGVVSRILPDEQMPMLPDGTPVDCVISFIGIHARKNTGQLWEAAASWIAQATGDPFVVPPYRSPSREEMAETLNELDRPHLRRLTIAPPQSESKIETDAPVLVGWVYWGCTKHRAAAKMRAAGVDEALQIHGEMEYFAFRNNGLFRYITETHGPLSEEADDPATALRAVLAGDWNPETIDDVASAPVSRMRKRLAPAGIDVVQESGKFGFRWSTGGPLHSFPLALRHPWLWWKRLAAIPPNPGHPRWGEILLRTRRLQSLHESAAPESLVASARNALQDAVDSYFGELLSHADVVPRGRRRLTGRAVIVPSWRGTTEEAGIPVEMAWTLYGPVLQEEVGEAAVSSRNEQAQAALERQLRSRWIIVHRAPTLSNTAMIAFRPYPVEHSAVELHPLVCRWMNADFDGDMVGVYLPISAPEETRRISVVGHLERDPTLLDALLPTHESLWGLSYQSETAGNPDHTSEHPLAALDAIRRTLEEHGPAEAVRRLEELFSVGLAAAVRSGASIDPVAEPWPEGRPRSWDQAEELLSAPGPVHFGTHKPSGAARPGIASLIRAVRSGSRGSMRQLLELVYARRLEDQLVDGGQLDGYDETTHRSIAADTRRQLHTILSGMSSVAGDYNATQRAPSFNLLARLSRSETPGVVAASAAESGETDPLEEVDARLTVGLLPKS